MPDAVVHYQPVEAYDELRSDYVRTVVAQAHLADDWMESLPRGIVGRATFVSFGGSL